MKNLMATAFALSTVAYEGTVVTAQAEIGGGAPPLNGNQCFRYSGRRPARVIFKRGMAGLAVGLPVRSRRTREKLQRLRLVGKPHTRRRL